MEQKQEVRTTSSHKLRWRQIRLVVIILRNIIIVSLFGALPIPWELLQIVQIVTPTMGR